MSDDLEPKRAPRRRRSGKKSAGFSGLVIGLILGGAAILVLIVGGVGLLVYLGKKASPDLGSDAVWQEFAPAGQGFALFFPGTPQEKSPRTYHITFPLKRVEFVLKYEDSPGGQVNVDAALDRVRDGMLGAIPGGKLAREDRLSLGTHPGRGWEFQGGPDRYFWARSYIVQQRLYLMMVEGPSRELLDAPARRFLDSLKIQGVAISPGQAAPQAPTSPGDDASPAVVLSNARISMNEFFPKVLVDYRFDKGSPNANMQYYVMVTAGSGKSYEQLTVNLQQRAGSFEQLMLSLPKTENGPFTIHLEMKNIRDNGRRTSISEKVTATKL
jgi:hypothetical protein